MTIGLEARAWAVLQFSNHGFGSPLLLWALLRAFWGVTVARQVGRGHVLVTLTLQKATSDM